MPKLGDVVLGLGGGKAIDSAKAIADEANLPVVILPTLASTDAPTSALSVIYTDDGSPWNATRVYDMPADSKFLANVSPTAAHVRLSANNNAFDPNSLM